MLNRFSLSDKWPTVSLGEAATFLDHFRKPVKESERVPGSYHYYGANGCLGTINDYLFDEPMVLLAEDGGHFADPIRPIAYRVKGRYWVNNHAHVIKPNSGIDLAYLCRVLENYDVSPFLSGTTRAKLNKGQAKKIPIPLPPLTEQRRIAAILDKADALRAKRREAIAKLDQLLQSVFLEMFGDPVTNPKNWTEGRTLLEVADVASGITKGRKTNGKPTRPVSYLAVANVQDRALDLNAVKEIDVTEREIEKYRLLPGDLLLTEGGDPDKLGRGALWQGELDPCIHQNHIFRVRVTSEDIDPVYLSWLVSSSRGKRYFLRSAKQTTGIASINMTQLRSFPLLIPPLELQKQFHRFVMHHYKQTEASRKSSEQIDELFKSVQQQAFQTAA